MKKALVFLVIISIFACEKKNNNSISDVHTHIQTKDENLDLKYEVLNQAIKDERNNVKNGKFLVRNLFIVGENSFRFHTKEEMYKGLSIPIFQEPLEYDWIFLRRDSSFYRNQTKIDSSFILDRKNINIQLNLITTKELNTFRNKSVSDFWKNFNKKYPDKCLKYFSQPFFSKEKNVCIISISTSCGLLYGDGFIAVYKKMGEKWHRLKTFNHWTS